MTMILPVTFDLELLFSKSAMRKNIKRSDFRKDAKKNKDLVNLPSLTNIAIAVTSGGGACINLCSS